MMIKKGKKIMIRNLWLQKLRKPGQKSIKTQIIVSIGKTYTLNLLKLMKKSKKKVNL